MFSYNYSSIHTSTGFVLKTHEYAYCSLNHIISGLEKINAFGCRVRGGGKMRCRFITSTSQAEWGVESYDDKCRFFCPPREGVSKYELAIIQAPHSTI